MLFKCVGHSVPAFKRFDTRQTKRKNSTQPLDSGSAAAMPPRPSFSASTANVQTATPSFSRARAPQLAALRKNFLVVTNRGTHAMQGPYRLV
jgi:hypothetical protein